MQKDSAQRSIRTYYEAISIDKTAHYPLRIENQRPEHACTAMSGRILTA